MSPDPRHNPLSVVNKLRFIWLFPVTLIGLVLLVVVAKLGWNQWFAEDPSARQILRPALKSSARASAGTTEQKSAIPGIFGRIRLEGIPPPERLLPLDATSAKLHAVPPTTRFYVVGNQGELADVFVYVKSGLAGMNFEVPDQPAVLKTVGSSYEPYISGLQTRQKLLVRNLDPFLHNIHAMPSRPGNRESNKAQLANTDVEFTFEQRDIFVQFKCDVHPWEFAYVGVVEHPFFTVTDQAGAFALPNVPPGKYLIEAVHRKAGKQTREITLGTNESQKADFVFEFKATAALPPVETRAALDLAETANPDTKPEATSATPAPSPALTVDSARHSTGPRISGRVRLQGTPPSEKPLPLDVNCGKVNTRRPTTRFYVVNEEGGLADVLVYVKSGLAGNIFATPPQPVLLNQVNCEYTPYISGLQTRQKLVVRNSDPFLHNVHPMPSVVGNRESNKAQLPGVDLEFAFEQPELFLKFKCDVHPWMFAYVCVLDHPFFAFTDQTGAFTLPNLPPGKYVLEAVHRKAGIRAQEITLTNEARPPVDFIFEIAAGP